MNLLLDPLPDFVEVGGQSYPIDTDFTTSIKFELLMSDDSFSEPEKVQMGLNLYYPTVPENSYEAFKAAIWFFTGGKDLNTERKSSKHAKRIYDFEYDAPYIYAAFWADYGIDLQRGLHWWQFLSLFQSLREENQFCKIMGYRAVDISKLKGEERKFYCNMQRRFALPLPKSEQEKLDAINEALLKGGDVSKIL